MDEQEVTSTNEEVQTYGVGGSKRAVALSLLLVLVLSMLSIAGTFIAVIGIWYLLKKSGRSWQHLGMAKQTHWPKTLVLGAGAAIGILVFMQVAVEPLLGLISSEKADLSQFESIKGNMGVLLMWLGVSWTLAAFGEEIVWRGTILTGTANLMGNGKVAWATACVLTSTLFGFMHFYQGPAGMIQTGTVGLCLCLVYLWSGKNLWIPILAHGLIDTFGFSMLYFGFGF